MTVVRETRDALAGGALVVADAGRLLVRHFPALLTVFLLGLAGRNAVLWAAVWIGREHAVLASLLLPLAPLSMVIALVVMLRIAGGLVGEGSVSQRLAVLTSALIPFLTVYTVTGQLTDDYNQFVNESFADEQYRGGFVTELASRTLFDVPKLQITLLVAFVLARLLIDVLDLEEKHPAWAAVQVLVEVTWLTLFANLLTNRLRGFREWLGDFAVLTWVRDGWDSVTDRLGPVADPVRAVSGLFSDTIDQVGPILLIPLAWLAVGAVVLGGTLPSETRTERFAPRLRAWRSRRSRWSGKAIELVGRRFEGLVDAVRVVVHAGLLPVLAFCLVLPLARLAEWGAAKALRSALGPRDPETTILFSRYLDIVVTATYTLVVVAVVAAAVQRLLLRREEPESVSVS